MRKGKFEIKESIDGRYYFRYKAENGWILCHSVLYSSKTGCLNALESVRRGSYNAEIIDLT